MRDGGDVEDGIRLGQRVVAGVVAERAFVAQRLGRVNVAFDDEVGLPCRSLARRQALGKTVFNSGKRVSSLSEFGGVNRNDQECGLPEEIRLPAGHQLFPKVVRGKRHQ